MSAVTAVGTVVPVELRYGALVWQSPLSPDMAVPFGALHAGLRPGALGADGRGQRRTLAGVVRAWREALTRKLMHWDSAQRYRASCGLLRPVGGCCRADGHRRARPGAVMKIACLDLVDKPLARLESPIGASTRADAFVLRDRWWEILAVLRENSPAAASSANIEPSETKFWQIELYQHPINSVQVFANCLSTHCYHYPEESNPRHWTMNSQDENILAVSQMENATETNEALTKTSEMKNIYGTPQGPGGMVNPFAYFTPGFQANFAYNPTDASTSPPVNQKNEVSLSYQQLLNAPMYPFQPTHVYPAQTTHAHKKAKIKDNDFMSSQTLENDKFNKTWSKDKDVALTKAWLYISVDADVGNNQKTAVLWKRVFPVWKENMGAKCKDNRMPMSLQQRWKKINQAVTKFNSFYEKLDRLPKSGTNLDDMKREAIRMYKECTGKKEFQFEHCWETLRTNPKWCMKNMTKKNEFSEGDHPTDKDTSSVHIIPDDSQDVDCVGEINKTNGIVRPHGRKASKEGKRKTNEDIAVIDAIKGLRSTFEKEIEFKKESSKKEFEFKQHIANQEIEVKVAAEKRKLKDQELREEAQKKEDRRKEKELHEKEKLEKKAQKREEQHRILSIDVSKLPQAVQKRIEECQMRILNEWETEGLFGENVENKQLEESLVEESRNTREIDSDKE
ncbi:transposon protein [Striga asiatica]|uniref:Transposon protein n=1 Tax=Striga asiatica TaxID=4170 RepID=A0A5A7PK95_STRAF|nr:transposon protein [Striga asiatica]